jgi:hypothetical protein
VTKHEQCETRDQLFDGEELEKSFWPPDLGPAAATSYQQQQGK